MIASKFSRRNILKSISITAASVIGVSATGPTMAVLLEATPFQPAGPFYHPYEPLSVDNDLLYNLDPQSRANGEVIYIRGRLIDQTGKPIKDARIEIWQANAYGRYNHPLQKNSKRPIDPNFLGFGHTLTGPGGHYRFRSIKPAPYPDSSKWIRPPHIHFAVITKDGTLWSTQMYFEGEELNKHDLLLNNLPSKAARERVIVNFHSNENAPNKNAKLGEFDIVLGMPGVTPNKA